MSPRQPETGQVLVPTLRGLGEPFQVPLCDSRGTVTERAPHTAGLAGSFLPQEKILISSSLDQGRDPWGDQESVNRPAAVGLETTTPPASVICVQQGLGPVHRQPWGAGVLDQMQPAWCDSLY